MYYVHKRFLPSRNEKYILFGIRFTFLILMILRYVVKLRFNRKNTRKYVFTTTYCIF